MDKAELLRVLAECAKSGDTESAHAAADDALIEFINDTEIALAYVGVPKWYA